MWVLARAERSWALVAVAAVYTAAALVVSLYDVENVLFRLGWNPTPGQWRRTALPNVLLPALVLLAAGAAAFAVQQRNLTITAEAQRADFGYLRDALDLTPGNLSRHLTVLEDAGLVQVEKGYEGCRPRTWCGLPGRAAPHSPASPS